MQLKLRFTGFRIKDADSEWNHNREAIFRGDKGIVRTNETELVKIARLHIGVEYLINFHEKQYYPIGIINCESGVEYLFKFNKIWQRKGNEYLLLNAKASMTKKVYRFDVYVLDKLFMVVHSQHLGESNAWSSFRRIWIESPELVKFKEQISVKIYLKEECLSEHKFSGNLFVLVSK